LSRELFDAFGSEGVPILERYGMTETLLTISNPLEGERRAGSVGFALPGVELDLPKPDGAEAELRVAGPTVFAGYWRRPNATAEVLDDGWVRTGDVVSVDDDGFIRICGRQKDLIITGGFNVYPTEVEDVLTRDPAIREAGVVGVASPEWGEEVVAFVVAAGGSVDARAAVDRQSMLLSSYKRPRRIIMVDELPRNAMGKLQRHLLRP
jgi:malonyl-CoA/methylmalonyl-CoA synthetase